MGNQTAMQSLLFQDVADPEASLHQRQWDEMYQHLVGFKETHGHPNVPHSFTKWGLGPWVDWQRREARKGFLDPRRAEKLNAIGLTWGKDFDERWEENFERLLAFKRKHGHCKVQVKNGKLGSWVSEQRKHRVKRTLKPKREARLEAVGFIWNGQSRNEAVAKESDSDNDSDSGNDSINDEGNGGKAHGSDQARGSSRLKRPPARTNELKGQLKDDDNRNDAGGSVSLNADVNVGTRISVLWDNGNYYGGTVTKMRPDSCFIQYYDGDEGWLDLETGHYLIIYSIGTQVYKNFPGHGNYWGEITMSKHDKNGLYYEVEYSDGDGEQITEEPDSAQLLQELHAGVLAATQKRSKRELQDSKVAATGSQKRRKMA
jgi:hypothetical protein